MIGRMREMEQKNTGAGILLISLLLLGCIHLSVQASGYLPQPKHPSTGLFLVASKQMNSSYFAKTVIMLVSADKSGAMGLIINRPTPHLLSDAIPSLKGHEAGKRRVYGGGPVMLRMYSMLFQSQQPPKQSRHITEDIYFSNNEQVFLDQAQISLQSSKIFFGYAGWEAGQLELEIKKGGWHLVAADPAIVFQKETENIWRELTSVVGTHWTKREGRNASFVVMR